MRPATIRDVLCTVLRKLPDRSNWSEYPNIWNECQYVVEGAPWYRVYDFIEAIYRTLLAGSDDRAERWQSSVNEYFIEAGVGWKMVDGLLETRGPEAFEAGVAEARVALEAAALPTARQEIQEALRDLSRRPDADLTGAVHHAMGALESTARMAAGEPRATLGEVLKRHPDLLPKPLDEALGKAWGYASEAARHIREGHSPSRAEAELIVGMAAAACTYLAAKIQGQ